MQAINDELAFLIGKSATSGLAAAQIADEFLTDEQRWQMLEDAGRKALAEQDAKNAEFVRQVRMRESARTQVPSIHADATLSETTSCRDHSDVMAALRHVAENYQRTHRKRGLSFVLSGNPGTGKTRMASALISQLALNWPTSAWEGGFERALPPVNAIFARQELVVGELMRPGDAMTRYVNADVLVLDDLAIRDIPQVPRDALGELISERHDRQRTTIITTNKTAQQLGEFCGARMASRFEQDSIWVFLTCAWADYRARSGA